LNIAQDHDIQLGFAYFWPDEFAEEQASDKEGNWFFVQWTSEFSYGLF